MQRYGFTYAVPMLWLNITCNSKEKDRVSNECIHMLSTWERRTDSRDVKQAMVMDMNKPSRFTRMSLIISSNDVLPSLVKIRTPQP